VKVGQVVRFKGTIPRNPLFHRKFFAMLNVGFDNQDKYDTLDAFRYEVMIRSGFYRVHHHLSGAISYEPESIAFGNMGEERFQKVYSACLDTILMYFMPPGTDREEYEAAVEELIQFA